MVKRKVKIVNKDGIHMKPSMMIVNTAAKYESDIIIKKGKIEAHTDSMMDISMLGAGYGEELIITAEGKDEEEAVVAIEDLINSGFESYVETDK